MNEKAILESAELHANQVNELGIAEAKLSSNGPLINLTDGRQLMIKHLAITDFHTYLLASLRNSKDSGELLVFQVGNSKTLLICPTEESARIIKLSQIEEWGEPREDWFRSLFL